MTNEYELLNRYFSEGLSVSEKAILFEKLANNNELKEEYAHLRNTIALSNMVELDGDALWAATKLKEITQTTNKSKRRKTYLSIFKYVAVAALLVCAWFVSKEYTLNAFSDEYTMIEVPKGQRVHITLPDGTTTWLSSRTKMKISNQFNKTDRIVELDGEGLFSVSKNERNPFIVKTKHNNVQAVGTQFNVFSYSESSTFETDLIEGAVYVYDRESEDEQIYLTQGEKAHSENGTLIKSKSSFGAHEYVEDGIYHFTKMAVSELVVRLELWYNVKIHVLKPEIVAYSISGKFRQSDKIENILQALQETGKFGYQINEMQEIEIF